MGIKKPFSKDDASSSTITVAIIAPVIAVVLIMAASAVPYTSYSHVSKEKEYDVAAEASEILQKISESTGFEPSHGTDWTEAQSLEQIQDAGLKADQSEITSDIEKSVEESEESEMPNSNPVAMDDKISLSKDMSSLKPGEVASVVFELDVLKNDFDMEDDSSKLIISVIEQPKHGTASAEAGLIKYTPDITQTGTDIIYPNKDSFRYKIEDTEGLDDEAKVDLTIFIDLPENDPPIANDDHYNIDISSGKISPQTLDVLANDEDEDPTTLIIDKCPAKSNSGFFTLQNLGDKIIISPDPSGITLVDYFKYEVKDSEGLTDRARVTITITGNNPPVARDDFATVEEFDPAAEASEDDSVIIDILANDGDAEGSVKFVTLEGATLTMELLESTNPTSHWKTPHGSAVWFYNFKKLRYDPDPGFVGIDKFSYKIKDELGATDTATVTVDVIDSDSPPQITGLSVSKSYLSGRLDVNARFSIFEDDGDQISYSIDWGDGSSSSGTATPNGLFKNIESHTYLCSVPPSGSPSYIFVITLTTSDDDGSDSQSVVISETVSPPGPEPGPQPVPPPCCFPAGTMISMADGSLKPIEKIQNCDMVLSYDVEEEKYLEGQVLKTIIKEEKNVYDINDGLLSPTDDHPLYVRKGDGREGWAAIDPERSKVAYSNRDAMQLELGDELFTSEGWVKINSIEMQDNKITTYTFSVDLKAHDYFANGVLASNALACPVTPEGPIDVDPVDPDPEPDPNPPDPSYCCFPAGTKITLNDGSLKNIEDIEKGDFVLSCDTGSKEFLSSKVVHLITKQRNAVYEINDGLLSPTDDHPLYVRKSDGREGWAAINPEKSAIAYPNRKPIQIEIGDELFTSKGWIKVESINKIEGEQTTYTFTVDNNAHDYFANGVLASNGDLSGGLTGGTVVPVGGGGTGGSGHEGTGGPGGCYMG